VKVPVVLAVTIRENKVRFARLDILSRLTVGSSGIRTEPEEFENPLLGRPQISEAALDLTPNIAQADAQISQCTRSAQQCHQSPTLFCEFPLDQTR
jgi:hypothetical protein